MCEKLTVYYTTEKFYKSQACGDCMDNIMRYTQIIDLSF